MRLVEGDVAALIAAGSRSYGAIILDVDDGPDGLTREATKGYTPRRGSQQLGLHFGLEECSRSGPPRRMHLSLRVSPTPVALWTKLSSEPAATARGRAI
jgi:hypothetical protein